MTYEVTGIQFNDMTDGDIKEYSATVVINNSFVIQVSGNEDEALFDGITHPEQASWHDADAQKKAYDSIDNDDVEREIEEFGFENNYDYLLENSTFL